MRAWWWRSVAACASLAAVAGVVATVAAAVDADRSDRAEHDTALTAEHVRAADPPPRPAPADEPPPSRTAAEARTDRIGDPALGVSLAAVPGWRRVPGQRLVPVPPGRFPLVVAPNDRAAVLVGALDPARVGAPADPARIEAETRRLVDAFADGASPRSTPADVGDAADTVDGRRAWTSVRRTDGGPRELAGTLVRVTAVAGAPRGVVALAVVRPGPGQAADARAADAVVRSLDLGAGGRASETPVERAQPAEATPAAPPAPPRTARPPVPRATPSRPPARPGEP